MTPFPALPPLTDRKHKLPLVILQVAAIWIASDIGFYFLMPALQIQPTYNGASTEISLYYIFWIGIAVITFWPVYRTWPAYGPRRTFENRTRSYLLWIAIYGIAVVFAGFVLPQLPAVGWKETWQPPEFIMATPNYFLPKSIDILFQQLLVLAFVLALAADGLKLRTITLLCAAAFGGMHILLAFGNEPVRYVVRFMVFASLFGLVFPWLILRVRNGLAISYMLHWTYYAISVALPHIFLRAQ